jgi:dihydrofolate synthase/folylpolyglutamate synthase
MKKRGWTIPETAVRSGLERVVWPARLQLIRKKPQLLLDSAHNPMGIQTLILALRTLFQYDRLILVFGVLEDKAYRQMLAGIAPLADEIILTKPLSDRALEPDRLVQLDILKGKRVEVIPDIEEAWEKAVSMAEEEDMVCGAGSIYFVGEVLRIYKAQRKI